MCNTRGAAFECSSAGDIRCGGGPNQHICNKLTQWALSPLSWCGRCSGCFIACLCFTLFFCLFLSMGVCTGQHLLLSVVFCQIPSAFALSWQIRLGSYEMPLKGHWLWWCLQPCASPHRTLRCCGCGWPSSCSSEGWALVLLLLF